MWKILSVVALLCLLHRGFGETGCPEAEDIKPCVCTGSYFPALVCQGLTNSEELRKVFKNSERYSYGKVQIEFSALQYLPYEIFETVIVDELRLLNTTLTQLFDRPPQALDKMRVLHIEDTKVLSYSRFDDVCNELIPSLDIYIHSYLMGIDVVYTITEADIGIIWEILEPLKNLRILEVHHNSIKTLGSDFNKYATRELEQIRFFRTGTKTIKPGTLSDDFKYLYSIEMVSCGIKTLTRDIFPNPYKGAFLVFPDNKIENIPEGLFTNMEYLTDIDLRKNRIATIPAKAFDSNGNVFRQMWLKLEDNPLKCDCLLFWMVDVVRVRGFCASPKRLQGRELYYLERSDFNC